MNPTEIVEQIEKQANDKRWVAERDVPNLRDSSCVIVGKYQKKLKSYRTTGITHSHVFPAQLFTATAEDYMRKVVRSQSYDRDHRMT